MPFLTVIPCLRTPYGVDGFDYLLNDESDIQIGDLVTVPFRTRSIPALVSRISDQSAFSKKIITLSQLTPLIRFSPLIVDLISKTAAHSFSSQASILHAWLRTVPRRATPLSISIAPSPPSPNVEYLFTSSRFDALGKTFKQAQGRTLILTPWQSRADKIGASFQCSVLHADLASGSAWKAWTNFLANPLGRLVTTRLGAWLSLFADTLIIDEPENDDYKQDELAPRIDARRLIETAETLRTPTQTIFISTTPQLRLSPTLVEQAIPTLTPTLTFEPRQHGSSSGISGLSGSAVQAIRTALEKQSSVIILHPIPGERSRIVCRDCSWTAPCPWCGFSLTRSKEGVECRRCHRSSEIPPVCANCKGADLNKSRTGKDHLAAQIAQAFPSAPIQVVDLPDWHRLSIPRGALILLTDLSLIGGVSEDIRRKERLAIAWRRIAATAQSAEGKLFVQGPEMLLTEARTWLEGSGLLKLWKTELSERAAFGYPPARQRIKLLFDGTIEQLEGTDLRLKEVLGKAWTIEGPLPVLFRSSTRKPRCIFHLLPPIDMNERDVHRNLEPFAKEAIIDLDPIAFFS